MKIQIINYILVIGLLAFSGFPYFYDIDNNLLLFFFFSLFIWYNRSARISKKIIHYLILFLIIFIVQIFFFKFIPFYTILGFFVRLLCAYFVISSIKVDTFLNVLLRSMVFFSLISLIFYLPALFNDSLVSLYNTYAFSYSKQNLNPQILYTFLIFNLNFGDFSNIVLRNSGPFWEPGAFGGFLLISIFLNRIRNNTFFNLIGKILFFTLITTFSTSSYVILMLIILLLNFSLTVRNLLFSAGLVALFLFAYETTPFLKNKITQQLVDVDDSENYGNNRFESFIMDMNDFAKYPIFGRGISDQSRYDTDEIELNNRNNGISDFLVKFGIIAFLVYFIEMYKSLVTLGLFYNQNKKIGLLFYFTIILIGFSEPFYVFPFFFGLTLINSSSKF